MTEESYPIFGPSDDERCNIPRHEGHYMIELFRVKINRQGHLSGEVASNDGMLKDILYDQVRQPIREKGGDLLLIGPPGYLVAYDGLTLYFKLELWNNSSSQVPDDIISDMVSWHSAFDSHNLNKPSCSVIEGRNGILFATALYAVFDKAIEASVEVMLIDKENPIFAVHGIVTACNNIIPAVGDENYSSARTYESVQVEFGEPIPFSRSVVAVPLKSNLIIRAVLHNQENSSSNDLPFFRAKIASSPKLSGTTEREILNKVKVKVTWRDYFRG